MRFLDYKCNACGQVSEFVLRGEDCRIQCESCGSENMSRVFSGVCLKSTSERSPVSEKTGSGCSGSCATCSGCP